MGAKGPRTLDVTLESTTKEVATVVSVGGDGQGTRALARSKERRKRRPR